MRLAAALALWLLPSLGLACEATTSGRGLPGRSAEIEFTNTAPGGGQHENWVRRGARLILHAGFERLTDEYGHAIMGSVRDAKALTIHVRIPGDTRITCPSEVVLPDGEVFEDIAPRLADMDGDGMPEIVVVQSNARLGAKLAIYDRRGRLVAATPNIGQRFRWLAPVGVADFDADGRMDVAYVDRPHLAKTLLVWRFAGGKLTQVAALQGVTNHRIGEEFIASAVRACGGRPDMILTDGTRRRIVSVRFDGGGLAARDVGPYMGPDSIATAARC